MPDAAGTAKFRKDLWQLAQQMRECAQRAEKCARDAATGPMRFPEQARAASATAEVRDAYREFATSIAAAAGAESPFDLLDGVEAARRRVNTANEALDAVEAELLARAKQQAR